jgi:hypothetical protein
VAGAAFQITVSALDAFGNVATGYLGTVHFSSTDTAAVLPANYAFTALDQGKHTFTVTLNTLGGQTITATDTVHSSIAGKLKVNVTSHADPGRRQLADLAPALLDGLYAAQAPGQPLARSAGTEPPSFDVLAALDAALLEPTSKRTPPFYDTDD